MNNIIPIAAQPLSMFQQVQRAKDKYYTDTGHEATKLFISIDNMTELLIEVLPGARAVSVNKNAKNQILGMDIYRVIEPNVIVCC